jgi:hypothetical protein
VTLLGLFAPGPEGADASARLSGAEGVAICDSALSSESNDVRRTQLILARAIHHIEAGQHQAAIEDARLVNSDRPIFAATPQFQLSLRLSALEVEALAHAEAGRTREAANKAMEMAEAAPYDLLNVMRASRYVALTGEFGDAERAYFERLVRLYPLGVADRAALKMTAGDFRGAAEDYLLLGRVIDAALGEASAHPLAQAAIAQALSGQGEVADRTAASAVEALDQMAARHPNTNLASTREMLDFFRILRMAQTGRAADARLLFSARSGWTAVSPAAVTSLAGTLRQGVEPAQLTGLLAEDPAKFRADALAAKLTYLREGEGTKTRFTAMRAFSTPANYTAFSDNVWRTQRSRYLSNDVDEKTGSRTVNVVRNGGGLPSGYALLLHSALVARSEGKTSFMLMPLRSAIFTAQVRTGNEGDANIIAPVSFNAERVIQDLTPLFPQAESRRRR